MSSFKQGDRNGDGIESAVDGAESVVGGGDGGVDGGGGGVDGQESSATKRAKKSARKVINSNVANL